MEKSIKSLLASYHKDTIKRVKKLKFEGVGSYDVYNITAPFKIKNSEYILGRVERRENEISQIKFFKKKNDRWVVDSDKIVLDLQDPFIFRIQDLIIIGGVETKQKSNRKSISYRTVFYCGKNFKSMKKFLVGPWGMKGIKMIELENKKIGVFTRPQGKIGRRGKIGFGIFNSLNSITTRKLSNVKIIKGQFYRGEWGGVNQAFLLDHNKIGILGHIANYEGSVNSIRKKYYYPISFIFNPSTKEFSNMKILVSRKDLPEGDSKKEELHNVIYPGGIIRKNGIAMLYAGVGDAESYEIKIKDPF